MGIRIEVKVAMSEAELSQLKRIGRATFDIGHYEKALECFDKVLGIDPKDLSALEYKGLAHLYMGEFEEAERCFDEILSSEPQSLYGLKGKELVRKAKEEGFEAVKITPRKVSPFYFALEIAPTGVLILAGLNLIDAVLIRVIG